MASGKSPYERSTYRYSPLIAFLLMPNSFLHQVVGKVHVSSIRILKLRGVPEKLCTYSVMVHLHDWNAWKLNVHQPLQVATEAAFLVWACCSRESISNNLCTSIIILLDPLYFQPGKKPSLMPWNSRASKSSHDLSNAKIAGFQCMITWRRVVFGIISGFTFLILTGLSFYLYGWDFLHEALLYHLTRTDPRHNFSIYFYHIYLHYEREFSILEKLISFLPQFTVQLSLILRRFALDLPFCLFLQTVAFVAFNKVITAQYFVWFFCLLPLILPWSNMKLKWRGVVCIFVWIGAQMHWLMWGYLLEFRGKNVFLQLWMASLLFLAANSFVMINVICSHVFCPLFKPLQVHSSKSVKDD